MDTGSERVLFLFRDNDEPATVTLSASPNPVTEGSAVTITATLSQDPSEDVTIPLTIPAPGGSEIYGADQCGDHDYGFGDWDERHVGYSDESRFR